MRPTRKATRKTAGGELTEQQAEEKYQQILRSGLRIAHENTFAAIKKYFTADDVQVTAKRVSLLCPVSQSRIKVPARGVDCRHLECFDLRSYLLYHTKLAFWECPYTFCKAKVFCDQLRVDEYFTAVVDATDERVHEVELHADGTYKVEQIAGFSLVKINDEEPWEPQDAPDKNVVKEEVPNEASEHNQETMQPSPSDADQPAEADADEEVDERESDDNKQPEAGNESSEEGVEISVDSRPFQCHYCPYRASKKSNLRVHEQRHRGEKRFKCRHCPYRAALKVNLINHEMTHTGEKRFKCRHCPFCTRQKHTLEDHERTHTGGQKPYACDECDFQTAHSVSLKRHKRIHSGEKPYECAICGERFRFYSNVRTHMASRHGSEEGKTHACTDCDFRTAFSESLARHRRTHTGEKPYKCEVCGAAYRQYSNIQEHMRKHTGEKPYKCQRCDKTFTSSGALATHVKTHSGEKPYACDFCKHRSAMKANLQRHVEAMHEGVKPFSCDRCDESSSQRQQLDNHIRKHGGEGSLKCEECDATFRMKGALTVHARVHRNRK
ncbi:zinc finger protein [Aphelenchoides avenae]|nr:zinc finger protein [Aphelenchus avenae]